MSHSISKGTPVTVGENFTFRTRYQSIANANVALQAYIEGIKGRDEWVYEESKMPIFLDTCVLLNLYDISETEREEFIKFVRKNKDRIYVPSQVQREYNRRRVTQIKEFKDRVMQLKADIQTTLAKLANVYKNEKNGVTNLSNRNLIKYGMPQVASKLKELENFLNQPVYNAKLQDKFKNCSDFISQHIDVECENCWKSADFEYVDPVQMAIAEAKLLPSLSDEERKYIEELYGKLRIPYDALKPCNKDRETITFPGAGDNGKSAVGPIEESVAWGDLYIYHEMLRFMKENDTDVVFMTRDITKGDWIKEDHRAFVHYIVNGYEMTGHLMYILDADGVVPTFNAIEVKRTDTDEDEIGEKPAQPTSSIQAGDAKEIAEKEADASNDGPSSDDFDDSLGDLKLMDSSTWKEDSNEYRMITRAEMIDELVKTTKWAKSYGAGYVGERHFIYNILSQKHYDHDAAKEMLDELVREGKVDRCNETHDEHTFNCLVLKEI